MKNLVFVMLLMLACTLYGQTMQGDDISLIGTMVMQLRMG